MKKLPFLEILSICFLGIGIAKAACHTALGNPCYAYAEKKSNGMHFELPKGGIIPSNQLVAGTPISINPPPQQPQILPAVNPPQGPPGQWQPHIIPALNGGRYVWSQIYQNWTYQAPAANSVVIALALIVP